MILDPTERLVCPRCRRPPLAWPIDPVTLRCGNAECQTQYPRLASGIPLVVPDAVEEVQKADLLEDLRLEHLMEMVQKLDPGDRQWDVLAWCATYLSSHYGGRAQPYAELCDRLLPLIITPVRSAVDLGCGPGRLAIEVAHRTGAKVVGMDLDPLSLTWALAASRGQKLVWPALKNELEFGLVEASAPLGPAPGEVRWLCADAIHPPLEAEAFDLALAVNLLDNTRDPYVALGQACALLRVGGHLLLAQPDAWTPSITAPDDWLAVDEPGWDRLMSCFGLRTLARLDDLAWELSRTPRLQYRYVLHGRLAVKEG